MPAWLVAKQLYLLGIAALREDILGRKRVCTCSTGMHHFERGGNDADPTPIDIFVSGWSSI